MKKGSAKLLILIISVSLILTAFTGCGSGSRLSAEKENAVPEANSGKTYTFSWTSYQNAPLGDDPYIIRYFEKKFNVKINVWNIDKTKLEEILAMKMASGDVPDLIKLQSYSAASRYMSQGVLTGVSEQVIARNSPNMYKEYNEIVPGYFKDYGVKDGKIYYINPIKLDYYESRPAILYRGDWLQKLGYPKDYYPKTLQEFEQVMYKFAKNDPDGNGRKDTYGLSDTGMSAVYGAFGFIPRMNDKKIDPVVSWQSRDGKLVFSAVQPEIKEALSIFRKWYKDGVLDPEFITGERVGAKKMVPFMQGRIGFTLGGRWYDVQPDLDGTGPDIGGEYYEEMKKNSTAWSDNLIYGEAPVGPTGKFGVNGGKKVREGGIGFGIQLEKEPEKLARLLQVLDGICFTSAEEMSTAIYGYKGKDWDYNKDGEIERTDPHLSQNDDAKKGGSNTLAVLRSNRFLGKQRNKDFLAKHNWSSGNIADELFKYLPSEGKYISELVKLQDEAYISIITGAKPLEYFDEFVRKWRASGGDILEKEANEK